MERSKGQGPPVIWDEVVSRFQTITSSIGWIARYRLQYYQDANLLASADFAKRLRFFIQCLIQATGHAAWIMFSLIRPGKSFQRNTGTCLFLMCDNPTYQSTIVPVLKETFERSKNITVLTRKRAVNAVRQEISGGGLDTEITVVCYEDTAFLHTLGARWERALFAIFGCLKDIGIWIILGPHGRLWSIPRLITFSLVNRFYCRTVEAFLAETGAIVAANDHVMWEALVFDSARDMPMETFVLQHGVLGEFAVPMFAKKYLVWGEYHREVFIKELGGSPEAVVTAGSPKYDGFLYDLDDVQNQPKDTVCFLSQSHGALFFGEEGYREVVDFFFRLARDYGENGYEFVVKLHPYDEIAFFAPVLTEYGEVVRVTREDLPKLLSRSLMTVLLDSTAVFEAALMGVPVVQLKTENITRFFDFSGEGLSFLCNSYEELESLFKGIAGDDQFRRRSIMKAELALDRYFANRGTSKDFIVTMILQRPVLQSDG